MKKILHFSPFSVIPGDMKQNGMKSKDLLPLLSNVFMRFFDFIPIKSIGTTHRVTTWWIVLLILPLTAFAQVDSTAVDSVSVPVDSLFTAAVDTLESDSAQTLFQIRPWIYHPPLNAHITATDSTLRWNIWPSWVYKKNRDPGVTSFRMGSIGRTNSFSIFAHQPKYLELYWGDIRMNDPVTGVVNWNVMPLHKIVRLYEADLGLTYRTTFYLKEYHLLKPLTKLIYSESKFEFRNLEFMLSRNFGRKTNAEISYWYRSGGGEYLNSSISGHQIYARVSHHLTHRQKFKLTIFNTNYNNEQPFGYLIDRMELFNFNRFLATPVEPNATSERGSTIIALNYYRRPADSMRLVDNLHAGMFMHTTNRKVKYSVDTTYYAVQGFGANVQKWFNVGPAKMTGAASYKYFINKDASVSNMNQSNWSIIDTHGEVIFQPLPFLEFAADASYKRRSDSYSQYLIGTSASLSLLGNVKLTATYTSGTRMPTIQQLYWKSAEFRGDPNLLNEEITEMHIQLGADFFNNFSVGARVQLKQIKNGIMVVDSAFTNINPYGSFSATAWFDYVGTRFEFFGSSTLHQFGSFLQNPAAPLPLSQEERIWFKAGAYIKGYLFDRATYVKAGLNAIFSPQPYRAAHYFTPLDYWQPLSNDPFIPAYHRVDVDLSARVRTIMVTLRYENVLDGLLQQGYFETANYPMNRRRLIFGIKVFFRN